MATMSKAEEAQQDRENLELPPPTYEASITGQSDDYQMVEAGPAPSDDKRPMEAPTYPSDDKRPVEVQAYPEDIKRPIEDLSRRSEEKRPIPEHYAPEGERTVVLAQPSPVDGKRVTFLSAKASETFLEQPSALPTLEHPPALPRRPSSLDHGPGMHFTLSWKRAIYERTPYLDYPSLSITPTSGQYIPSTLPDVPPTSHWRLNYEKKYFARLHRYAPAQTNGDLPSKQVAEIKYPEYMWPGSGAKIKFEPHEEEIARRGSPHVSRTDKLMHRTGWFTAKYGIDLPILNGSRVCWQAASQRSTEAILQDIEAQTASKPQVPPTNPHTNTRLITLGDALESARRTVNDQSWTPFPTYNLIEESSGRVLATYTRSAPWGKTAGSLHIIGEQHELSPEYIEGIIIACAAMVGMKDRMGLMSSLIETSTSAPGKRRECNCSGEPANARQAQIDSEKAMVHKEVAV